jgi:DNA-binding CsgD family transcriptional regulator
MLVDVSPNESRLTLRDVAWSPAGWSGYVDALVKRDGDDGLGRAELERLGTAAYLCGREGLCEDGWTRAHRLAVEHEDWSRAARTAFWLWYVKANSGQMAVGGGWLARGQRILEEHDPEAALPEQGWFHLPVGIRLHYSGQFAAAQVEFGSALEIAGRHGDVDLVALARHAEGRALIGLGEANEGTARLDEAMVAVLADEVAPIPAGIVYCSVIEACQELLDVARAKQWTTELTRWCGDQPDLVPFRGRCSIHRSEILLLEDDLDAALVEADAACKRLADPFHNALGAAHYQRGEVHRVRGEHVEATEAYRQASELGAPIEPGSALLRLAKGDVEGARDALAAAFADRELGARDMPLVAAAVEVAVAGGDHDEILGAADRLSDVAALVDAPLATGRARHWLGVGLLAVGDVAAAAAELRGALAAWTQIHVPRERDATVAALRQAEARLESTRSGGAKPLGLSRREIEVLGKVADGASNRQVADALCIAERTVARHLSNIFVKLGVSSRTAAAAVAHQHGLTLGKQ